MIAPGFASLVVALCAAACSPSGSTAPTLTADRISVRVDAVTRTFVAHSASSAAPAGGRPLILVFHGRGGSGEGMRAGTGFDRVADAHGGVVAYLDAVADWAEGCGCSDADRAGVNDTGFVRAVIDTLVKTRGIDRSRVYGVGYSAGGFFVHRLACEMSDRIAGVADIAGSFSAPLAARCRPSRAIPVIVAHGTADGNVPYDGIATGSLAHLAAPASAARWGEIQTCAPAVTAQLRHEGARVPVFAHLRTGCRDGSRVVLYELRGGGHGWPRDSYVDIDGARAVEEFFFGT